MFDNKTFARVNGYPNCYWGWGPEDLELGLRCSLLGYQIEKRDGTYQPLPHKHAGFEKPGVYTSEAKETAEVFSRQRDKLKELSFTDGLSNVVYSLSDQKNITVAGKSQTNVLHYWVKLDE